MIKKIFLGALLIILAKCGAPAHSTKTGPTINSSGPIASLNSKIDSDKNNGQISTIVGNAAIKSNNNLSITGTLNGSPIMTNNIAANTITSIPVSVNTGTIKNKNIK